MSKVSERLSEIGYPLSIQLLSRIERGDRNITVDDVSAISFALKTRVSDLLVPDEELEARERRKKREDFYWMLRRISRHEEEIARHEREAVDLREDLTADRERLATRLTEDPSLKELVDEWEREMSVHGAWHDGEGPADEDEDGYVIAEYGDGEE